MKAPWRRMTDRALMVLGVFGALVPSASAQDRPFVFSLTTAPDTSKSQVLVDYDIGTGEQTFHSDVSNAPEQRVGIQASLGRWTLVGNIGMSMVQDAYSSSQQGELLYSVSTAGSSAVALALGGGMLHEPSGTDVWLVRVIAGHDAENWRLTGNLLMQMPHAPGRDAVDLITTVGWARRMSRSVSLGLEGVGEDLEGFWDPTEAEGGARILVGPSFHVMPPGRRWQLSVAGGPTFHPTHSPFSSDALRDLPAQTQASGYAVRTSFACTF